MTKNWPVLFAEKRSVSNAVTSGMATVHRARMHLTLESEISWASRSCGARYVKRRLWEMKAATTWLVTCVATISAIFAKGLLGSVFVTLCQCVINIWGSLVTHFWLLSSLVRFRWYWWLERQLHVHGHVYSSLAMIVAATTMITKN